MSEHSVQARLIAFYLPQYHPIPENDLWWGKGFTEWVTVAKARPMFRDHYQPHIPADLGFYDLRLPQTRQAQADLASDHGIEGFCYWHYWLGNGRRLLERPFDEVLASGVPDFPFCLGWANHPWVGGWFGSQDKLLVDQKYPGPEDSRSHFKFLLKAFEDPRYITVNGRPLFYIYLPYEIPDVAQVLESWRELAHSAGLNGLYIVGENLPVEQSEKLGFDAVSYSYHRRISFIKNHARGEIKKKVLAVVRKLLQRPEVYSYEHAMKYFLKEGVVPRNEHPTIVPGWDSTPRLGHRGVVLQGSTPDLFRRHVQDAVSRVAYKPFEERILFVKSWNEWAEGNYMEPDQKFGRKFLEALRDEVLSDSKDLV